MDMPIAQLIDPAGVPSLRWGVYGTGWITEEFVTSVQKFTNQQIVTIASRTAGKAKECALAWGIPEWNISYEELAQREDIDAIYIATRPVDHLEHALIAINAGKHVLIEKPVTTNPEDARKLFAAARAAGVLAMEAMWNLYLPQDSVFSQLRSSEEFGKPRLVLVDFCQDQTADPRKWNPEHGTILFDMGIYPVSFCLDVLGFPDKIEAIGKINPSGVEEEVTAVLSYDTGERAIFTLSGLNHAPHHATISGTAGIIEFETPFVVPSGIRFMPAGFNLPAQLWEDNYVPRGHQGLNYQANAFAQYVSEGKLESSRHPQERSVQALEIIYSILRELKVSYI